MSTLIVSNIKATGETASRSVSGVAAAWINFNGTGAVAIRDSVNVSSLTDNGTGDYSVNYTNSFSSVNFSVSDSSMSSATFPPASTNFNNHMIAGNSFSNQSICYFGFYTTSGGFTDADKVCLTSHGDLA